MKAVVTGGAGFIGSNIAAALCERGDEVIVIDNLSSGYAENLQHHPDITLVKGSILDRELVDETIAGANLVFHHAASVGNKRSIVDPRGDMAVNAVGTINVLEASRHGGVRKIVYASSAGIFGELRDLPISESHPVEPNSPYGASKLAGEKACLAYATLHGLEAVALRYFNVYGPHQRFDEYGNVIPIFVFRMLRGKGLEIFGDGEQTRDFINVRDVVQANLKAAGAKGVSGAFNIGSGTRVTINSLVREVMALAGQKIEVHFGPPRPGDVRDSLADISRARQAFGFSPSVALSDGLRDYVEWARDEVGVRDAAK